MKYSDVRLADEVQFSVYNFEMANVERLWRLLGEHEAECKELLGRIREVSREAALPVLAAYDQVLKCSHLFNLLDARGAISVTERVGVIKRVRDLAVGTAKMWADQQAARRGSREPRFSAGDRDRRNSALDDSGGAGAVGQDGSAGRDAAGGCDASPAGGAGPGLAGADARFRAGRQRSADYRWRQGCRGLREEAGRGCFGAAQSRQLLRTGQEGFRPRRARHSGGVAARRDPRDPVAQDHVLDRSQRTAFHPPDPLDGGAAGRSGDPVRDRRRSIAAT